MGRPGPGEGQDDRALEPVSLSEGPELAVDGPSPPVAQQADPSTCSLCLTLTVKSFVSIGKGKLKEAQ